MDVNEAASLLGKMGGIKGGPARAAALSPERRKEIAKIAANKRWGVDKGFIYYVHYVDCEDIEGTGNVNKTILFDNLDHQKSKVAQLIEKIKTHKDIYFDENKGYGIIEFDNPKELISKINEIIN